MNSKETKQDIRTFKSPDAHYHIAAVILAVVVISFFWNIFTYTGIEMIQTLASVGVFVEPSLFGQSYQHLVYAGIGCFAWIATVTSLVVITKLYDILSGYKKSDLIPRAYD